MQNDLAEKYATLINQGCKEENILKDALVSFIYSNTHQELIKTISDRLPEENFKDEYWFKGVASYWPPVFAAVMYCSSFETFKALIDAGYSSSPIQDLHFHPDPKTFLDILALNEVENNNRFKLYAKAIGQIIRFYTVAQEVISGIDMYGYRICYFHPSSYVIISLQSFDFFFSDFISYGYDNFNSEEDFNKVLFSLARIVSFIPELKLSLERIKPIIEEYQNGINLEMLIGTSIWVGNKEMYFFLASLPAVTEEVLSSVEVIFSDSTINNKEFFSSLLKDKFFQNRERILKSLSNIISKSCFHEQGQGFASALSYLFEKFGPISSEDFSSPVIATLLQNEHFWFEKNKDILYLLLEKFPEDYKRKDSYGRNAAFYAFNELEVLKLLLTLGPELIRSKDNEEKNLYHHFFIYLEKKFEYYFNNESLIEDIEEIDKILPRSLLEEKDIYGKQPWDYCTLATHFKLIV